MIKIEKIVLKASAGTGKTYRLSLEYLSSLLNGELYDEILVVTFTKKATEEIKVRIFEHIKEILDNTDTGKELIENIKNINNNIIIDLDKLELIYKEMLINKDKIKIYTIDGFTNIIFKKIVSPYLNMYNYEIISSKKNSKTYELIFEKIVSNDEFLEKFKIYFSDSLEDKMSKYINTIEEFIKDRWKFVLLQRIKSGEKKLVTRYTKKEIINVFDNFIEGSINLINEKEGIEPENIDYFRYFNKDFNTIYKLDTDEKKISFMNSNFNLSQNIINMNRLKKDQKEIQKGMQEEFIEAYLNYNYNEKIIDGENNIIELANIIFSLYDDIKIRDKKFTHSDISNYVFLYLYKPELEIIVNEKVEQNFYELIDSNIKTMFIDEFQDTSIVQWKILSPIINSAKRVICVGDEKQSIYGWRGGEKNLFKNLPQILNCKEENLDTTYRQPNILIDFVNTIFTNYNENWQGTDVKTLKEGGYLNINLYDDKIDEDNIFTDMVDFIKNNIKNYQNTAIIARKNSTLTDIAYKLEKAGIDYVLNSNVDLVNHRIILGIYHLLKFIKYREFIDLIQYLRSDAIFIQTKELQFILENREKLEQYLNSNSDQIEFDFNKHNNLKVIFDFVKSFIYKYENPYYFVNEDRTEIIENISKELFWNMGFSKKYDSINDIKNIYNFIFEFTLYDSIDDFVDFLIESESEESFVQETVTNPNAVNLMTIHKSKGLEFENLLYYFEKPKQNNMNLPFFQFFLNMDDNYDSIKKYMFLNRRDLDILENVDKDFTYKEKLDRENEEINNSYVALTRAKSNLLVYGKNDEKNSNSISNKLNTFAMSNGFNEEGCFINGEEFRIIRSIKGNFYEKGIEINEGIIDSNNINFNDKYLSSSVYKIELLEKIRENKIIDNKFNHSLNIENARKDGLLVHYYLEFIKYNSDTEKEIARNSVLNKYGNMFGYDAINKTIAKIERAIKKNREIFDKKWMVHNEYDIYSEKYDINIRIDRICIDKIDKKVIIVDYKTGYTKEQSQLDKYENIVREILGNDYKITTQFLEV